MMIYIKTEYTNDTMPLQDKTDNGHKIQKHLQTYRQTWHGG